MKYIVCGTDDKILQFLHVPGELTECPIANAYLLGIDESYDSKVVFTHVVVNGELQARAPVPVYAAAFEIKNEWLHREQAPILVGGYYLDCDPISELRIKNTIEAWDYLPLIPGQLEEDNGVRSVVWTLADNTKQRLLLVDLQNILPALVTARAVRAAVLYSAYQGLKVRSDVSHAVLKSDLTWG